jgi:hypothetical protein
MCPEFNNNLGTRVSLQHHVHIGSWPDRLQYQFMVTYAETNIRFDILTPVLINSIILWDITSCSSLKVNRRFGGIHHCHILSR